MVFKNAQNYSKKKMLISTNTSMLYFLVVEAVTAGNSLSEDKEWRLEEESFGGCTRQADNSFACSFLALFLTRLFIPRHFSRQYLVLLFPPFLNVTFPRPFFRCQPMRLFSLFYYYILKKKITEGNNGRVVFLSFVVKHL
jgi:hypothetical protein